MNTVNRAREIRELYQGIVADLGAVALYDGLPPRDRKAALAAMDDRSCRIVVCVNMLGEGFDMPQLKVAAVHDVRKSLSPMIQLIGRFTRTASTSAHPLGTASVFVARDPSIARSPLRDLLKEDADWNDLLHDITERSAARGEELSEFDASFAGVPTDMAVSTLEPKMSVVAHRAPNSDWDPQAALSLYGEDRVLGQTVAVGADGKVAWFVVEHRTLVDWGAPQFLEQIEYELIVMYFDDDRRLLYIYGSHKRGDYKNLAKRVLGGESRPVKGIDTFRVFAGLQQVVATNIGLLDARGHFNRFSLSVSSDVFEALNTEARRSRSQTHIMASGIDEGTKVSVSAALSGRFWSMRAAPSLLEWTQWCDEQGTKLLDSSVDLENVMAGFIIPVDQIERPPFPLLGLEWPWEWRASTGEGPPFTVGSMAHPVTDIGFRVDDFTPEGPFRFSLISPTWEVAYRAAFTDQGLVYSPVAADAAVKYKQTTVSAAEWINKHKPYLYLAGDRLLTPDDQLLEPRTDLPPFDVSLLSPLDWHGVNIKVESMWPDRLPHSIPLDPALHVPLPQRTRKLRHPPRRRGRSRRPRRHHRQRHRHHDHPRALQVLVRAITRRPRWRSVRGLRPGSPWREMARVRDRGTTAKTGPPRRQVRHPPPWQDAVPDRQHHELYRIRERAPHLRPHINTVIAQPGLSAAGCSSEQQHLLAGAHSYVKALTGGTFTVHCSM
ncbi:helicase C-terminal domain-containing protein [Streptomyces griseolus]|uniref:helicase C-terminal domain-containing protein n=1 Tax=Streptomyces griseolus TaxID=1909 RepID=UPI0022434236|nr:helicase C-terminal domain-containing protein [Streptomyces griseolus]